MRSGKACPQKWKVKTSQSNHSKLIHFYHTVFEIQLFSSSTTCEISQNTTATTTILNVPFRRENSHDRYSVACIVFSFLISCSQFDAFPNTYTFVSIPRIYPNAICLLLSVMHSIRSGMTLPLNIFDMVLHLSFCVCVCYRIWNMRYIHSFWYGPVSIYLCMR